jgi:hypothetical protein
MKNLLLGVFLLLTASRGFGITGNEFLQRCGDKEEIFDGHIPQHTVDTPNGMTVDAAMCAGYIQAIVDLMVIAEAHATLDKPSSYCFPEGVSLGQAGKIVTRWMKNHPERTHEIAGHLGVVALKQAFPCK